MKQIEGTNYYITQEGLFFKGHKQMFPDKTNFGHLCIRVTINGKRLRKYIHRLVAEYYIPNPYNKPIVNHKDGNPSNNSISNLEWVTHRENIQHAYRILKKGLGESRSDSKLTNEDVLFIRKNYKPHHDEFGRVALSKRFGISQNYIWSIISNKRWKHI